MSQEQEQEQNILETRKTLLEMIANHSHDLEQYVQILNDLESLKNRGMKKVSRDTRKTVSSFMIKIRRKELESKVLKKLAKKYHGSNKQYQKGTPEFDEAFNKQLKRDSVYRCYVEIGKGLNKIKNNCWNQILKNIDQITTLVKDKTYDELILRNNRFFEDFCNIVESDHIRLPKELEVKAAEEARKCMKSKELTLYYPETGKTVKMNLVEAYETYMHMDTAEEAVLAGVFKAYSNKPCAFLVENLFIWLCGEKSRLSNNCASFLRDSIVNRLSKYMKDNVQPALIQAVKEQISVQDMQEILENHPIYGEYITTGKNMAKFKSKYAIEKNDMFTDEHFSRTLECIFNAYIDKFRESKNNYDQAKAVCEEQEKRFLQMVSVDDFTKLSAEDKERRKKYLAPFRNKMYRYSSRLKHLSVEISDLIAYFIQDEHWVPGEKEILDTVKNVKDNLGSDVIYTCFNKGPHHSLKRVSVNAIGNRSIINVIENIDVHAKYILSGQLSCNGDIAEYLITKMNRWLLQNTYWDEILQYIQLEQNELLKKYLTDEIADEFFNAVSSHFSNEKICNLLTEKPYYGKLIRKYRKEKLKKETLHKNVVTSVPDAYKDLYPATRMMHRHFVLHVGPTNSGKTYDGIQALIHSRTGVYLAPLRMLAFEKYEELNAAGIICDLITGEEEKLNPGATHISSTIEVANTDTVYDCVVIDECQLITDRQRGGAWTTAILGMQAKEIHLCMSPWAKDTIINIINDCGDSYDVIEHKRPTELVVETSVTRIPQEIRKHDAVITFSRKNVHAIASELEDCGMKCSLIYGSLPYDVRQNEAKRFLNGETDVVVATDAIGMGMNLPIERVVFAETEKYDGTCVRPLSGEEIRQIAGRAGRQGMYDTGYVSTTSRLKEIKKAVETVQSNGNAPMIGFPKTLLGLNQKISDLILEWSNIPPIEGFRKCDLSEPLKLAQIAERYTKDRMIVYQLAMIAFDVDKTYLLNLWRDLAKSVINGTLREVVIQEPVKNAALNALEETYHKLDIYYQFGRVFGCEELKNTASEYKDSVSKNIIQVLKKEGKEYKKCSQCGCRLPWDTPYKICDSCYNERYYQYSNYYNYY